MLTINQVFKTYNLVIDNYLYMLSFLYKLNSENVYIISQIFIQTWHPNQYINII